MFICVHRRSSAAYEILFGHFVASGDTIQDARRVLFAFACSLLLGMILFVKGNLWLCAGSHFVVNLLALTGGARHGGLRFLDDTGRPLLTPQIYIFLFFVMVFVTLYAGEAIGRRLKPPVPVEPATEA